MDQPTIKSFHKSISHKLFWNGRITAIITLAVIIVTAVIVFLTNKRSVYDELEITLAIISIALFLFLTYGLYNGASIIGKPLFPKLKEVDFSKLDFISDVPDIDLGDGITGVIGAILLWIVVSIIVFVLLTFVFTLLWSALLILAFVLYWLFFRAMRQVFLNSFCKGNLKMSIKYSFLYSVLYTGWIFGVVLISKYFSTRGL